MKRIVVVSTNANEDYYFYSRYIKKAWNTLGWEVAVMVTHDVDVNVKDDKGFIIDGDYVIQVREIPELRIETVAQASRLYAANYLPLDALIMTSDMDLLPLMDYWDPKPEDITVFGHDLTDYTYYPMGYIAMLGSKWKEVMRLTKDTGKDMIRDAHETKVNGVEIAFSDKWEEWWNFDWRCVTDRLLPYKAQTKFFERGRRKDGSGFAFGRIDRGDSMKIIEKPWIDAHCEHSNVMHPDKLNRFLQIFEEVYGKL